MSLISLPTKSQAPITTRSFFSEETASPIISSISHVPELLLKGMPFIGQALGPSSIDFRTKEIMILRASAQLHCTYCINTHTFVSIQAGLTHDEISALRGEKEVEEIFTNPKEKLLIDWTDAMANHSAPIKPELKELMTQHYSDSEIVEFSLCIGATIMLNRYATALSLPVDANHILTLKDNGFSIVS
jgi:AhpD family alkylhydroperoxidase